MKDEANGATLRRRPSAFTFHVHPSEISAFSMITSSSGTSWCMPREPVLTFLILSTTSLPSVTRPNTQ